MIWPTGSGHHRLPAHLRYPHRVCARTGTTTGDICGQDVDLVAVAIAHRPPSCRPSIGA